MRIMLFRVDIAPEWAPIIQDGKLAGAITHVFLNDPTRGYGIFIETMLREAEKIK